jgi:hypothetical protein
MERAQAELMDDSRFSRARSCVQWRVIACAFFSLLVGTAANLVRPSYQGLILDSVIAGAKNASFDTKTPSFYQDRLGTNIGNN